MDQTEARTYRAAYAAAVKRYSKMTKAQLRTEDAAALEARGMQRLYGGPQSKDELIADILELRGYTAAKEHEAIHTLGHDTPWPDCGHCQAAAVTA